MKIKKLELVFLAQKYLAEYSLTITLIPYPITLRAVVSFAKNRKDGQTMRVTLSVESARHSHCEFSEQSLVQLQQN